MRTLVALLLGVLIGVLLMPLDVGRVTHLIEQMHRSEDDSGDPIAVDKVLVTDGARGFTWEPYQGSEPPAPGVHKLLVKRTSDFTTTASNDSVPDYDDVIDDTLTDSWWDAGDPDGFVVTADYDGLDAIFTAKCAWADPGSSDYVEGKMYYFPAASGRNRPIHSSTDEDYLIGVVQAPATDNVNHFIELVSDPITVGTGDRIFMAWRTSTTQTAIDYNGRVAITLGAYIVGTPGPEGPEGPAVPLSDDTPLVEDGAGDPGVSDEASRSDHVHPQFGSGSSVPTNILLESGHAVPFTFDEILQESDGSDFLWASE